MSINNPIDNDQLEAYSCELYDQSDCYENDIEFILNLLKGKGCSRILEPFCGSGRILVPLLQEGYEVHGLDYSPYMLERCKERISRFRFANTPEFRLFAKNVVDEEWPTDYSAVILAANCFWQLGSHEEQLAMITKARDSMCKGGYLYIENDNMDGDLPDSWCKLDPEPRPWKFPRGTCRDGSQISSLIQVVEVDKEKRLWHAKKKVRAVTSDGSQIESEWFDVYTHPSSAVEIRGMLRQAGFAILGEYRSTDGDPYEYGCGRAIFWARKE